jgi:ABC-2 type transport system ATP-binding protein
MIIETINLTKRYGELVALNNLHLNIEEGECFGYIGPNGAGKTTTIKILATLLQPTWGEARICGHVIGYQSRKIRPLIGYVPDSFGAYSDMVVQEYLEFFASAYGITGQARRRIVGDTLDLTDLTYKRDALVDSLSRGMKQRLSIARVLLHDPKVLLLDEPASGLDPRARIEMMAILQELQRLGKTIIISSHILSELQTLCNRVAIIEKGKLIYSGAVQGVRDQMAAGRVLWVRVAGDSEPALQLLRGRKEVVEAVTVDGRIRVTLDGHDTDHSLVAEVLVQGGQRLLELREDELGLEEVFLRVTRGDTQ